MNYKSTLYLLNILVLGFSTTLLQAQTPIAEATRHAEVTPQWPGCDKLMADCTKSRLTDFITANVQLPSEAKAQGAGGVVMVEFVVEKNGSVGEVRTLHDPGLGLGTEAIRVVSLMTEKKIKWTPAEVNGKRIPFRYMTPVSFNLAMPVEVKEQIVEEVVTPDVYDIVDIMPRYAGCEPSPGDTIDCTFRMVISHIQSNLKYPESAMALGAQGPVVVQFVIDANGNITNPIVTKGLGQGCDEEALRIISLMPPWQPGIEDGKAVPVKMVVPILFQIPKTDKE